MIYKKYDSEENIAVGDLVSFMFNSNFVTKSYAEDYRRQNKLVIGVCKTIIDNDTIDVQTIGITDVNVTGLICIGDKLTASSKAGKAQAIKYSRDDCDIFGIRSIGKVVGLYRDYSIAKVLLDIE